MTIRADDVMGCGIGVGHKRPIEIRYRRRRSRGSPSDSCGFAASMEALSALDCLVSSRRRRNMSAVRFRLVGPSTDGCFAGIGRLMVIRSVAVRHQEKSLQELRPDFRVTSYPQNTRWPLRSNASATAFSARSASCREANGPMPFIRS